MEFNKNQKLLSVMDVGKRQVKKTHTGNDYVICSIKKGVLMSDKYREIFNDKTTLYLFLKSNIMRGQMINDPLNIYKKYYQNQQVLACSFTETFLAKKCNLTRYKVRKFISELKQSCIIRTEQVRVNDNKSPVVFILGTYSFIEGKKKERFYFDNVIEDD